MTHVAALTRQNTSLGESITGQVFSIVSDTVSILMSFETHSPVIKMHRNTFEHCNATLRLGVAAVAHA